MNIWNVIFALLTGIAFVLIIAWLFPMGPLSFFVGLGVGAAWFIGFIIYSSTKKIELSPIHMVVGFGFLFLALFGTVYVATFIVPEGWKVQKLPYPVDVFFSALGAPPDWLWLPAFIYLFLVPYITVIAIVEGFMRVFTEIFGKWAHVIAFGIATMTIPFGIFTRIVQSMFSALGMYAVGGFGLLFFFAVIAGVISSMGRMGFIRSSEYKELEMEAKYEKLKKEVLDKYSVLKVKNPDEAVILLRALEEAESLAKHGNFVAAQAKIMEGLRKAKGP